MRTEVSTPLIDRARTGGAAILVARDRACDAQAARGRIGVRRRRAVDGTLNAAIQDREAAEKTMRQRWGFAPRTSQVIPAWAKTVAGQLAEDDHCVIAARQQAERANRKLQRLDARHSEERDLLHRSICGRAYTTGNAVTRADQWTKDAAQARSTLTQIEALPIDQAATLIHNCTEVRHGLALGSRTKVMRL